MAMSCRRNRLISEAALMALIMWVVEILLTTWVIMYTWNNVVVKNMKTGDKPGMFGGDAVNEINFWEALLFSIAIKLLLFGMSGLQEFM